MTNLDSKERRREYSREWHKKHPNYSTEYSRKYRAKHPGYNRDWKRKVKKDNPGKYTLYLVSAKASNYKHRYGLTVDEYTEMKKKPCTICGHSENQNNRVMVVDHNHITRKVRGTLCMGCNIKLGWFERHKQKVIDYLE